MTHASFNLGGGVPSAVAVTLNRTGTNAPSVKELKGEGYVVGGSGGEVFSIGAEYMNFRGAEDGNMYHGFTTMAGAGMKFPTPIELHGSISNTYEVANVINVFDIFDAVYNETQRW